MSPLTVYKRIENAAVGYLRTRAATLGTAVRNLLRRLVGIGNERITIMVVPHSVQKRVVSFRVSLFSLLFVGLTLCGVVAATLAIRADSGTLSRLVSAGARQLSHSQASLQEVQSRLRGLDRVAAVFDEAMDKTMATLHIKATGSTRASAIRSTPPAWLAQADPSTEVRDSRELHRLIRMMSASVGSLQEIGSVYGTYTRVLRELPTMWPVQGGAGIITTYFGPAIEPFTHSMYLHLGIDIADGIGTPLVAAGDGTVTQIAYQPLGYGKYVMIRHCCGFSTRYAHMSRIYVYVGEKVKQGQVIGLMGDTGLSTGPHVHFEVHLGGQVIDPMLFMDIDREQHPSIWSLD